MDLTTIVLYIGTMDDSEPLIRATLEAAERLRHDYGVTVFIDLVNGDVAVESLYGFPMSAAMVGERIVVADDARDLGEAVDKLIDAVLVSLNGEGGEGGRGEWSLKGGRPQPLMSEGALV